MKRYLQFRCSERFKSDLQNLVFACGYTRLPEVVNEIELIAKYRKGVSLFLTHLHSDRDIYIPLKDQKSLAGLKDTFNRNQSNIQQLFNLCAGQQYTSKQGKTVKLPNVLTMLLKHHVKVNLLSEKFTYVHVEYVEQTTGTEAVAKRKFLRSAQLYNESETRLSALLEDEPYWFFKKDDDPFTQIVRAIEEAKIFKIGVSSKHPFFVERKRIYDLLNRRVRDVNELVKIGKDYKELLVRTMLEASKALELLHTKYRNNKTIRIREEK